MVLTISSLSPSVPHAQYRKRFRASYNIANDESPSQHVTVGLAEARPNYFWIPALTLAGFAHFSLSVWIKGITIGLEIWRNRFLVAS